MSYTLATTSPALYSEDKTIYVLCSMTIHCISIIYHCRPTTILGNILHILPSHLAIIFIRDLYLQTYSRPVAIVSNASTTRPFPLFTSANGTGTIFLF